MLQRLDGPELAEVLAGRRTDTAAAELSDALAGDQAQLDELAVMFGKQESAPGSGAQRASRSSGAWPTASDS